MTGDVQPMAGSGFRAATRVHSGVTVNAFGSEVTDFGRVGTQPR